MSNTITSSNMLLPIPVVGIDTGPDYALNVDACLALIDSHNHSANQGVKISPNGININADLPFSLNNATLLRSVRFSSQSSPLSVGTDLGCLYEAGVDLYFNDGNGNQIRITQSGSVAGATGTITGLPSGTASAAYSGPTFTFQSATSTAANLDGRNVILRNSTASSKGLTLSPPTAMAADFSLVLPALPAASATFVQLDTSGNMTAVSTADGIGQTMTSTGANAIAATRTRIVSTTVATGGVAISASSGTFSMNSATPAAVTNLSVTITTSGRPVFVGLIADGSAVNPASIGNINLSTSGYYFLVYILQGTTIISIQYPYVTTSGSGSGLQTPPSSFHTIDAAAAGTYTYSVKVAGSGAGAVGVNYTKLIAYEL